VAECHKPQGASFAFVQYADAQAAVRAKEAVHYQLVCFQAAECCVGLNAGCLLREPLNCKAARLLLHAAVPC